MRNLLLVLLFLPALAGCLTDGSSENPPQVTLDDALAAHASGADRVNVDRIGEWNDGAGAEIDAWEHYLAVMRAGGVDIVDISDPTDPTPVGRNTDADAVKDVKWSDDGAFIFTASDDRLSHDATTGIPVPTEIQYVGDLDGGIYVLDAADKGNPTLVHHFPVGPLRGAHMVFYYQHSNGDEIVLGANADISINRFSRNPATLTELSRYSPSPEDYNRNPDVVDPYYQLWAHDMFAMYDDVSGQDLMYVANWDAGLRIVDISDPANPVEIGAWMDFPEGHTGNLHTVVTEWIGDRRITAGAVEVGFNIVGGKPYVLDEEPSVLYIWDTTDPANIQLLGMWTNPDGLTTGLNNGFAASTHNIQLENGRITMAHYGLGVWVLDLSTPDLQAAPQILGYYNVDGMSTWDVLPHDGVIWSSGALGVQALHFAADTVGEGPRARA